MSELLKPGREILCKTIILIGVGWASWVAVTEPIGRLPSAPSLSRSAPSLASRLGPDGLQSTIAEAR